MRYLYIIGNGFDIAHGIKSGYSHYKEWLKDNKDFQSILNLFNYTFSYSYPEEQNGHIVKVCVLEPNITGDYTKIVYDQWGGIVYHITTGKNLDSILKNGIRLKHSKERRVYRKYDDRIFVTGGSDFQKNISILIKDLGLSKNDYVVLKINLKYNHHKIRFFRDPIQNDCLGLYTRENISPECIEEYPFEDTL